MQSVSSSVWNRVAVSNSYDDNHYTTGTSNAQHYKVRIKGKVEQSKERRSALSYILYSC